MPAPPPVTDIGVGVFVSALREALVAGEVDAAVHSCKDLRPPQMPGWCSPPYQNVRIHAMPWWPGTG
jgi:hypothetical protein